MLRIRALQPKDVAHRQHMIDSLQVYVSMFSGPLVGGELRGYPGASASLHDIDSSQTMWNNYARGGADDVRTFPPARPRNHACPFMCLTRPLLAALVAHHCILLQWNFDPPRHHVMRDPSKHPKYLPEKLRPQWATPPCSEIKPSV